MRLFESWLVRADEQPWAGFFRMALGYLLVPSWSLLTGGQSPGATLVPFFLGVLVLIRLVPLVVRRLLPFSVEAKSTWMQRRQLSKRFDSYQWQKLMWMGIGLTVYAIQSAQRPVALLGLILFCLLSGAAGFLMWRRGGGRTNA